MKELVWRQLAARSTCKQLIQRYNKQLMHVTRTHSRSSGNLVFSSLIAVNSLIPSSKHSVIVLIMSQDQWVFQIGNRFKKFKGESFDTHKRRMGGKNTKEG